MGKELVQCFVECGGGMLVAHLQEFDRRKVYRIEVYEMSDTTLEDGFNYYIETMMSPK